MEAQPYTLDPKLQPLKTESLGVTQGVLRLELKGKFKASHTKIIHEQLVNPGDKGGALVGAVSLYDEGDAVEVLAFYTAAEDMSEQDMTAHTGAIWDEVQSVCVCSHACVRVEYVRDRRRRLVMPHIYPTHTHTRTHTHTFTRGVTRHCRRKGYVWTSEKRGARRAATCPTSTTPSCCCTGSPSGSPRVLLPQAPPGGVLGLARRRASAGAVSTRLCVYRMCMCVCCMCIRVQCGALRGASAGAVSTTVRLRGPAGSLHACVYMPHASTHTLAACTCRYLRLRGRGGGRALALFAPAVQQAPRSPGRLRQCERRGQCGGR